MQKEILTKECIEKLADRSGSQPGSRIILAEGTVLTPLAEDYIREKNLILEFGKVGQDENSERASAFNGNSKTAGWLIGNSERAGGLTKNKETAGRQTGNSERGIRFNENTVTTNGITIGTEAAARFTTGALRDTKDYTKTGHLPDELPYDTILRFYYLMLKIRFFEEFAKAYKQKDIIKGDFVHVYLGEEAIAAGVCSALKKEDFITSTHRGHGHMIAKGADVSKMFAELLGKADGYSKGKGGSMHIADIGLGILGANGIVGAGLPIACGSALASKLNGDNSVTVAFFGDGASNQGTFGESLNFAKIFSLPVIFFCENNGYAISTSSDYACSTPLIYKRGLGYDIPSVLIDGDDIFEVYFTCRSAIEEIRKSSHPVLIEAVTHRREGHWIGDPQNYRSAKDLADLPKYDPIKIFFDKIKTRPDFRESDVERITLEVSEEIRRAVAFAEKSAYLSPQEAAKDYLKE